LSQHLPNSKIKAASISLLEKFDKIAQPRIKHSLIKWFWNKFFLSHSILAIQEEKDEALKEMMRDGYYMLKPIFEQEQLGLELVEAKKKYNAPMPAKIGSIKEALELVPDAGL